MERPVVYGGGFSVYVQAVRLALAEKGVAHELVPVDPFEPGGVDAAHLERQPFGLIPAFADATVRLYEADAIARHVDEAYPGPSLMPATVEARARANQLLGILRAYAYPTWVRTLDVEQVTRPRRGIATDEAAPDGAELLRAHTDVRAWWDRMRLRESVRTVVG